MRLRKLLCLLSRRLMASLAAAKIRWLHAFCLLTVGLAVMTFLTTSSVSRVDLTSDVRHVTIDLDAIQRDAIDTILIENEGGAAYIAFQIPKSSKIIEAMKGGTNDVESKRLIAIDNNKRGTHLDDKTNKTDEQINANKNMNSSAHLTNHGWLQQNQADVLSIHDHPYTILNKNICSEVHNLTFVILVHTSTTNFVRRRAIRETWANHKLFKQHNIRTVFLLGQPERDSTQVLIEHENYLHGDIVQGTFRDTYQNLTHKAVLGIRWVSEHCPNTKIVVKVDDDVFVNVFQLMDDVLNNYSKRSRNIFCNVRPKGTAPIERKKGKWKVKETEFFNMTHYPFTYCNGYFTVVTADIVQEIYNAAKDTPFFWVDDVYLYGILPDKIGNVTFSSLVNLNLNEKRAIECFESTKNKCKLVVANAHTDGVMDTFWYRALEQNKDLAAKYATEGLL